MSESPYDVIVVGAGNAALAAAASAREQGAERVLVLEKAARELRGGNTHYSGGLYRFAFDSPEDLRPIVPDAERQVPGFYAGVQPYPADLFWADLLRVTEHRTDPDLANLLIGRSYETVRWLVDQGIVMEAAVSLSAIKHGDTVKWSPGAVVRAHGEGVGLSKRWFEIMDERGVEVRYETGVQGLRFDGSGAVDGVHVRGPKGLAEISARAVVLGCGGFEANPAWRARYLGAPWDQAKVRGTAFNTGDGLRMAFDQAGALPHGQFTGCHSTPIDADAPPYGDRKLTDKSNRLSYPYGVMVNRDGRRFADEGEDFQFYTYAKMGRIILDQPGGVAWQLFDSKMTGYLESRYKTGTPLQADTLDALIDQMPVDREAARKAVDAYNTAAKAAVAAGGTFDPTILDGVRAEGPVPPKSNWALPLDTPPYYAYSATGGITFTFGGVRVDQQARIIGSDWKAVPGLHACGEMVGGLFHHNYPGGSGLMSGAVFGRLAGASAARWARER